MNIKETLKNIIEIQEIIKSRAENKYDASNDDWRSYSVVGIEYNEEGATVNLEENQNYAYADGFPEHESVEMSIEEIEMSSEQWELYLEELRKKRDEEKRRREEQKKKDEIQSKHNEKARLENELKKIENDLKKINNEIQS